MRTKLVNHEHKQPGVQLYPIRFLVCITFGINLAYNAFATISFAAIQQESTSVYNVSPQAINMFSLLFQILYLPGTILSIYMFKRFGLRKSFIFASIFQFIGSIFRYISVNHTILSKFSFITNNNNNFTHFPYAISIFGTCFIGMVQPFYTNSASRIPAEWFSVNGRDIATAILSIVNVIGFGCGMVIPTLFVQPCNTNNGNTNNCGKNEYQTQFGGFAGCLALQGIIAFVGAILTIVFHKNKPPLPPSMSQRLKLPKSSTGLILCNVNNDIDVDDNRNFGRIESGINISNLNNFQALKSDVITVMKNKSFLSLFVGFGVGQGFFVALATLINQYTSAFGYNSNDAGIFGACLIGGGMFGAVFFGTIMEISKKFKQLLRFLVIASSVLGFVFITQMKENNLIVLNCMYGSWGFVTVPILPVCIECAAECTYPIDEDISNALLMVSGSIMSVVCLLVWGSFLPSSHESYHNNIWNDSTYFILTVMFLCLVSLWSFNGEYLRLNVEKMNVMGHSITRSESPSNSILKNAELAE